MNTVATVNRPPSRRVLVDTAPGQARAACPLNRQGPTPRCCSLQLQTMAAPTLGCNPPTIASRRYTQRQQQERKALDRHCVCPPERNRLNCYQTRCCRPFACIMSCRHTSVTLQTHAYLTPWWVWDRSPKPHCLRRTRPRVIATLIFEKPFGHPDRVNFSCQGAIITP